MPRASHHPEACSSAVPPSTPPSALLGFSYTIIESPDGFYGVRLANGSSNGLIGEGGTERIE